MDANGSLLSLISSHDGDKQGTAFFVGFFLLLFLVPLPSPKYYFELCSIQPWVQDTLMRMGQVGDSPTDEPIQNSPPDQHLLPNN